MINLNNKLMQQKKKNSKCINAKFQSFAQQTLPRGNCEQWSLISVGIFSGSVEVCGSI
jgi:hypothetical protein